MCFAEWGFCCVGVLSTVGFILWCFVVSVYSATWGLCAVGVLSCFFWVGVTSRWCFVVLVFCCVWVVKWVFCSVVVSSRESHILRVFFRVCVSPCLLVLCHVVILLQENYAQWFFVVWVNILCVFCQVGVLPLVGSGVLCFFFVFVFLLLLLLLLFSFGGLFLFFFVYVFCRMRGLFPVGVLPFVCFAVGRLCTEGVLSCGCFFQRKDYTLWVFCHKAVVPHADCVPSFFFFRERVLLCDRYIPWVLSHVGVFCVRFYVM